jgi:hypothetical protein
MSNKRSLSIFASIIFLMVSNTAFGQQGHVVFGDPATMCSGTGLCTVQNTAFVKAGGIKSTPAMFISRGNEDGTAYALVMVIDLAALSKNDPLQYRNFLLGSYLFTGGTIPANVLNNITPPAAPVRLSNLTSAFSASNLPNAPVGALYFALPLGTFPGPAPSSPMTVASTVMQMSRAGHHRPHHKPHHGSYRPMKHR